MNFLFLTTMMILIFTLASTSMTTSLKTTARAALMQKKQMEASYAFHNREERLKYNRSKRPLKTNNDEKRKEKRKEKTFIPRYRALSENSKLNLYPIIDKKYQPQQQTLLVKTLKSLIEQLYGEESFFLARKRNDSMFLEPFVKELVTNLKKTRSLAKIPFAHAKDREFYLMICKGAYSAKATPTPLLDYITLQRLNNEPPLVFPAMSAPLVRAYFGEEIAQQIFAQEEQMYFEGKSISRISKEELEKLLSTVHHNVHSSLLTYTYYKFNRIQEHAIGGKDTLITRGPPVSL